MTIRFISQILIILILISPHAFGQLSSLKCYDFFQKKYGKKILETGFPEKGSESIDLNGVKSIFFTKSSSATENNYIEYIDITLNEKKDRINKIDYTYAGHFGLKDVSDKNINLQTIVELNDDCSPKSVELLSNKQSIAKVTPKYCENKFPCETKIINSQYSKEALSGKDNGLCEKGSTAWLNQSNSNVPKLVYYTFDINNFNGHLEDVSNNKPHCYSTHGEKCVITKNKLKQMEDETGAKLSDKDIKNVLALRNARKYFPDFHNFDHKVDSYILNHIHSYFEICNYLRKMELTPSISDQDSKKIELPLSGTIPK